MAEHDEQEQEGTVQEPETTEAPADAAGAPTEAAPDADTTDAEEDSSDVAALRREAAAHRRKARDAETERDTLAGRVEALQRAEAQRLAGAKAEGFRELSDPSDLWRADVELSQMLDDDGQVDAEKVREAVGQVGKQHPGWLAFSWGSADAGAGAAPKLDPDPDAVFGGALRGLAGRAE